MPSWGPDGFSIPRGSLYYGPLSVAIATAAQFSSVNPVLPVATIGYESDTGKIKFGDGATDWNTLSYWVP